jgi:ribosomal protein L16/L10AE
MGTGKGSMDYWASRIPVSRIIFEVKGELHEQVVRDAFRVAGAKMPGKTSSSIRYHTPTY